MSDRGIQEATASTIMTFSDRLEDEASNFYSKIAEKYQENRDIFLSFIKESKKNKILLRRTYQETVTDALETGFSFRGLDLSNYEPDMELPTGVEYRHVFKKAIQIEDNTSQFYTEVAERSKSLLATIPRAFKKVADMRKKRKLLLQEIINDL